MSQLADECRERASYLKAVEPEGLSVIERQSMETLFKAADALSAQPALRDEVLEEAAKVASGFSATHYNPHTGGRRACHINETIATAIRALKSKTPAPETTK